MSATALVAVGFGLGVGAAAGLLAFYEYVTNRPRRHRQRGNYFDARQPFRIESRGPAPHVERSETLIARQARRLSRYRVSTEGLVDALRRDGRGA